MGNGPKIMSKLPSVRVEEEDKAVEWGEPQESQQDELARRERGLRALPHPLEERERSQQPREEEEGVHRERCPERELLRERLHVLDQRVLVIGAGMGACARTCVCVCGGDEGDGGADRQAAWCA